LDLTKEHLQERIKELEDAIIWFKKKAHFTLSNGCRDSSCVFKSSNNPGGQHTNSGCRCFDDGRSSTAIKKLFSLVKDDE